MSFINIEGYIKIILFEIQYNNFKKHKKIFWTINQVIQTYQTWIIQGLKDIEHKHHQTFRFVKGNLKLGKFKENNKSF